MRELWRKLLSRKLWMAAAGIAAGVCVALGGDAAQLERVAGAVAAAVSAVAYVLAESRVDAAAARERGDGEGQ